MKTYSYKDNIYNNLYDLSEAMGQDGTFIPRTISDADLKELGVDVVETEEPIANIRARKIVELKRQRDSKEVEPIAYDGHLYDYDSQARDRISAAIIWLDAQGDGAKISWTTADNVDSVVTAHDLRMIIAYAAERNNKLHTAYNTAKEQVEVAQSKVEIDTISIK